MALDNSEFDIAVIGAGYIGSVLSGVLADRGARLIAIDVDEVKVSLINEGRAPVNEPYLDALIKSCVDSGKLKATTDFSQVASSKTILITVGTPLDKDFNADTTGIMSVIESMIPFIREDQLIILKSTVPPLTTEKYVATPLREVANVKVAFCPERLAEGNAIEECRNIPVVVGGVDEDSEMMAADFWRASLGVEVILVGSARAAEMVKLADNAWIDLNIALAMELARLSDRLEIDVLPVITAANSLPKGQGNVNILAPSIGVGGYCLTKDPWFLHAYAKSLGGTFNTSVASRSVNESAPEYAANRFDELYKRAASSIEKDHFEVAILGLSFKNNTGDCRFTPTLPLLSQLEDRNYNLKLFDPWVNQSDLQLFKGYRMCTSLEEALINVSAIIIAAGHDVFRTLTPEILLQELGKGGLVFDGRRFFSSEDVQKMRSLELNYAGIGI